MDNNARTNYELQTAVMSYVSNLMAKNDVPAYMMEDALNKVLLSVQEVAFQERMNKFLQDFEEEKAALAAAHEEAHHHADVIDNE